MKKSLLRKTQERIFKLVADKYPEVYLVGGTAISFRYNHRISEDLDFFTQNYTQKLHRGIVATITWETGYKHTLVAEETRNQYLNMAVYEFRITKDLSLKIDFVSDYVKLIEPNNKDGMASITDIYYRKLLAVTGWNSRVSVVGGKLAGGRQKTKDLFDVFTLSGRVELLSEWFPKFADRGAYERLVSWYLAVPKQKTIMELLDLAPGCDTRAIFTHLDGEIIHKLNRKFVDA